MDYYGVTVTTSDLPGGQSPEQYLDHVRTNINDYIDGAEFNFYPGIVGEVDRWMNDSLGTVFQYCLADDLGASASIDSPVTYRPDFDEVADVC